MPLVRHPELSDSLRMRHLVVLVVVSTIVSQINASQSFCPDGFTPMFNGACGVFINFHPGPNLYTYATASSLCHNMGGFLPSVTSKAMNDNLRTVANGKTIILGLSPGDCKWDDGSKYSYSNYDGGYTCSYSGRITTMDQNGKWYAKDNSAVNVEAVICTAPPKFSSRCAEYASVGDDSPLCYDFHTEQLTWHEASATCARDNATLAVIHDRSLNDFIRRTAVSQGITTSVHIGLSSSNNGSDDYEWADGSEVDYINFAKGFPKHGSGDCTAMQIRDPPGKWTNEFCEGAYIYTLPFVCIRPVPEQLDEHCPTDYVYKNGDNIFSPGFPTHYSDQCDYLVLGGVGSKIRVEVIRFAVNTCCASLTIFDGFGKYEIARLTGEIPHTNFTSTQSSVRIAWNSAERGEMLGWHLRVFVEY